MNRARVWTRVLGFGALLMIPLLSLAAWVLLEWLVRLADAAG